MSDTDRPTSPPYSVEDMVTLMAAMRESKVALLETPAVKLALMPDGRAAPATTPVQPEPTSEQARLATLNARSRLEEQRRARIEAQAKARGGPIAPPVTKLVEQVYTEAKDEQLAEDRQSASPDRPAE